MRMERHVARAAVLLAGVGCGGDGTGFPYPFQDIILCGQGCVNGTDPSDRAVLIVGGNATFTWDSTYLGSTIFNSPSATQRLEWTPNYINQELIAYNLDWGEWVQNPNCQLCFTPYTWSYASLRGDSFNSGETFDFSYPESPGGPTFSMVRHWHGSCAVQIPWVSDEGELDPLNDVSDQLFKAFVCNANATDLGDAVSASRLVDEIQPHFTGFQDFSFAGIMLQAVYTAQFGPAVITVEMNPAWSFDVRESDGLLDVTNLQRRVVVIGDPFDFGIEESIDEALIETFPTQLELQVEEAFTQAIPQLNLPCDLDDDLETQQQICFDQAVPLAPIAFTDFWLNDGASQASAENLAQRATNGLQPRNFSCQAVAAAIGGFCEFHPVFLRVNVLPDELEFVLAAELSDEYWLYRTLEIATGATICGQTVRPREGLVARVLHGPADEDDAIAGDCAPYLP